ncbi:MAG: hypothetical protein Q7R54_00490 [bacterium]|nr:hypothetical protein [bacterium]
MENLITGLLQPYEGISALHQKYVEVENGRKAQYLRNVEAKKPATIYADQSYMICMRAKTGAEELKMPEITIEIIREDDVELPYVIFTIRGEGFSRIAACPEDFSKEQMRLIDFLCGILARPFPS